MSGKQEFLDCKSNETIQNCPICRKEQLDDMYWPESGTHIFTIPYECGTEIDYPIGHDGAVWGVACDGSVKRFVMPDVSKMSDEQREKMMKIFKGM